MIFPVLKQMRLPLQGQAQALYRGREKSDEYSNLYHCEIVCAMLPWKTAYGNTRLRREVTELAHAAKKGIRKGISREEGRKSHWHAVAIE